MARRTTTITDAVDDYIAALTPPEHPALATLRATTARLGGPAAMQISPGQAQAMLVLLKLVGATRHLEVGTFTGYSAAAVALAGVDVVTCDINAEWTAIAQHAWQSAGIADRVSLQLAPAALTLDALIAEGQSFDSMFIDADKTGYDAYWERGLHLVRRGGVILVDNTLWNGKVVVDTDDSADTRAIRDLNRKIASDVRVDAVLLPVGDGLTVARRR